MRWVSIERLKELHKKSSNTEHKFLYNWLIVTECQELNQWKQIESATKNNMTENDLKPLLTDDFLETLRLAVKVRGWDQDAVETISFANWLFELAGKGKPDIEPFYSPNS